MSAFRKIAGSILAASALTATTPAFAQTLAPMPHRSATDLAKQTVDELGSGTNTTTGSVPGFVLQGSPIFSDSVTSCGNVSSSIPANASACSVNSSITQPAKTRPVSHHPEIRTYQDGSVVINSNDSLGLTVQTVKFGSPRATPSLVGSTFLDLPFGNMYYKARTRVNSGDFQVICNKDGNNSATLLMSAKNTKQAALAAYRQLRGASRSLCQGDQVNSDQVIRTVMALFPRIEREGRAAMQPNSTSSNVITASAEGIRTQTQDNTQRSHFTSLFGEGCGNVSSVSNCAVGTNSSGNTVARTPAHRNAIQKLEKLFNSAGQLLNLIGAISTAPIASVRPENSGSNATSLQAPAPIG